MDISIVIVNYNVRHFLEQCLISVRQAVEGLEAEVFVVDNCSTDGSVVMVRERFPWVNMMANVENVGFSRANNQAMQVAKGRYVVLLNPDTIVEAGTFRSCIAFMDSHSDAGGLGVRMVDGTGSFLPESKRSLPTPEVAFYKIFGLSALFPRSARFGRYHLTYLKEDETHQIEVLSGAFMLMRKAVLDRIGLLDEQFFMYGEDVDLSFRITQAGYVNYYFPEARIVHYKGESTKKGSLNYVFVFYNAMAIFARKHFSRGRARLFSVLINFAIVFRAALAVANRFAGQAAVPMLDLLSVFTGLVAAAVVWESRVKASEGVHYPMEYYAYVLPCYALVWVLAMFVAGGYDRPVRASRLWRGAFGGSVALLVIYALMGEDVRFSRAVVLMGAAWATVYFPLSRWVLNRAGIEGFDLRPGRGRRFIIIADAEELPRMDRLLRAAVPNPDFVGHLCTGRPQRAMRGINILGDLKDWVQVAHRNHVAEVVFCGRSLTSAQIIDLMEIGKGNGLEFRIAPPDTMFIIGTNTVDTADSVRVAGTDNIASASEWRMKRLFDVAFSILSILLLPVLAFVVNRPLGMISNALSVLAGWKTWVGYSGAAGQYPDLPPLPEGVVHPLAGTVAIGVPDVFMGRCDLQFAEGFGLRSELNALVRGLPHLGG